MAHIRGRGQIVLLFATTFAFIKRDMKTLQNQLMTQMIVLQVIAQYLIY